MFDSSLGKVSRRSVELAAVGAAGFSDAVVLEILGNVAVNLFANYFNLAVMGAVQFQQPS